MMFRRGWKVLEIVNETDCKASYFRTYRKAKEYHDQTPHSELHSPGPIVDVWGVPLDWDSCLPLAAILFTATVSACLVLLTLYGIGWI